jgi:CRP/FNR family transcriptional regulator, dissimilatory nitrate respiration regulator
VNVADILHDCRLFNQVEPAGFARLVTMARLTKYRKGQLIFRQGEECPGVFVVGRGMVRIFKASPAGKEHVLHLVGPGETFAEVAAIGGLPLPANAEAIEPATCALLPRAAFVKALQEDHPLCLGMMTGMAVWVKQLTSLLEDIVMRDAAGRLARYLLQSDPVDGATIVLPSLKRHVASHLNLTSETLSRTLRRMLDARLIEEIDSTRVRLLSREKLRQMAEGQFPKL